MGNETPLAVAPTEIFQQKVPTSVSSKAVAAGALQKISAGTTEPTKGNA